MKELIQRVRALEASVGSSKGIGKDLRVIEMQIARAEDKALRIARGSSWTRSDIRILMTEEAA